jgi:hypothetical protein
VPFANAGAVERVKPVFDAADTSAMVSTPPLAAFHAWLWVPGRRLRARGFATVQLDVFPRRLVVTPRFGHELFNYVLGIPRLIEYDSQAVVLQQLRPTHQTYVLLDVDGGLGSVSVGPLSVNRLRPALREAGFAVVETARWGWERPRRVASAELDGHADHVPSCFRTA